MDLSEKMNAVILLCFLVLINCAYAQFGLIKKQEPENFFETDKESNGHYRFGFVGTDNIEREESGRFDENQNYVVTGYYSYYDEHGKFYYVRYRADKDGYHVIPSSKGIPFSAPSPRIVAAMLG